MRKLFFYISILIISWVYALIYTDLDYDFWSRIAVGKVYTQLGHVLNNDIFSFTEKKALWIDHEWLSGVVLYNLVNIFDDLALIVLKIATIFTILFLIHKTIALKPKSSPYNILFYLMLVLAMFNGLSNTFRCQMFTFILFSLFIYILERVRHGEKRLLWTLVPLSVIWANLHGGFLAGLGVLGLYGVGEFANVIRTSYDFKQVSEAYSYLKYFAVLGISLILIGFLNPYGFDYYTYIVDAVTMPRPNITEWIPTALLGDISQWLGFKIVLLITICSVLLNFLFNNFKYCKLDITKYLILTVTLCMALKHVRHQPFFVIAAGSFIYHDFYNIFNFIKVKLNFKVKELLSRIATVKEVIIYGLIIFAGMLLLANNSYKIEAPSWKYPVYSVEFIKQNNLSGNLLTTFNWGSYATWKLYPQNFVAMDGRYEEVYSKNTDVLVNNFIYTLGDNPKKIFSVYKVDVLLLNKSLSSYYETLRNPKWKKVYEDKISAVFIPYGLNKEFKKLEISYKKINDEKYLTNIDFLK